MKMNYRKVLLTLLCLSLALLAWQGSVDEFGREYTDKSFKRALVTFAVARSLNGVISVAQGTEVAVQPAGIGINFTPGQILDPVNDLIERFSWIMLASSTSLGLQKMLLAIFSSTAFTSVIAVMMLLAVVAVWYQGRQPEWFRPLAYRAAVLILVVRFAIPLVAVLSEGLFTLFLEEQYTASTQGIEQTTEAIAQVNRNAEASRPVTGEETWLEKARRMMDDATASFNVESYIERYKVAASDASEHAINLIVIFVLQTILLPLLLLWLLVRGLKKVMYLNFLP